MSSGRGPTVISTATRGKTTYTLLRERPGWLLLRRNNADGQREIYFPEDLLNSYIREVILGQIHSVLQTWFPKS